MYTLLILFFVLAIGFSFLCSLWEAVLLSITPSFAQIKQQEGTSLGSHLQSFKENIDRPLSAILTLNTIAHTVGAIGVGEQATRIWSDTNPFVTSVIVPVAMTLAILILSEIIPKTIGATYWKGLASFTVTSLLVIIAVLYPLVWLSQFITRLVKHNKAESVLSRSDFVAMAKLGAREGVFEQQESTIINNLLHFDTIRVKDVMTPRTVMKSAPEEQTIAAFYEANPELRFSRIPIYERDSADRITGYVLKDEILSQLVNRNGAAALSTIRRDIMIALEKLPIPKLFEQLLQKREHVALVVDEFGGTAGIVTMEDVIETLLGMEIVDESDRTDDMQALARKNWERRAQRLGLVEKPKGNNEATD